MNEPETTKASILSWVFFLPIALSWKVLSPIEIIADCALLLAICRFLGDRGRIACLVLLGLFLVAAWADWLVIDFLVTSVLRGGCHVGLILLAVFILFVMWRQKCWRRFYLIYPVGLLVLTGFAYQLFLDWEYLKTMRLVESGRVGKREAGTTEPSPALFDALHHDDPASRANAVKILVGHFMMWEHDQNIMIMGKNQKDIFSKDQWWKHTYWDGNWPAPVTQRVMPRLIELLHDDSFEVKMQSLGALHHVGPRARPAVPALRDLLRSDKNDSVVRENGETDVEFLMKFNMALSGSFQQGMKPALIRGGVADALKSIGSKAHEAVPELIPLLQDVLSPIRVKALWEG